MKAGTYITEVGAGYKIQIPVELREKLNLSPGDKIEISIRKIKSRRFEIFLQQNPLYRLLEIDKEA